MEVLRGRPEPLLGLTRSVARTTHQGLLSAGDTLLLYTDGLIERRGRYLDDGIDTLIKRFAEVGALPVRELCDSLLAKADSREDDIALLALHPRDKQPTLTGSQQGKRD